MKEMNKTKRNNLLVLAAFIVLIIICLVIISVRKQHTPVVSETTTAVTTMESTTTVTETTTVETTTQTIAAPTTTEVSSKAPNEAPQAQEGNALFIGDSRTVGIAEYAQIPNADFFCDVGMSVYNASKKTLDVQNVGKVTLEELLTQKQYNKVYIMLGINEVGYNMNTTVHKYQELINQILIKQPNAKIILQANLHVTKERSQNDEVVNNANLNKLNEKIKSLADSEKIYYIDANIIFDDSEGNLASDKTGDNAHLYAKYYKEWGNWILEETNRVVK